MFLKLFHLDIGLKCKFYILFSLDGQFNVPYRVHLKLQYLGIKRDKKALEVILNNPVLKTKVLFAELVYFPCYFFLVKGTSKYCGTFFLLMKTNQEFKTTIIAAETMETMQQKTSTILLVKCRTNLQRRLKRNCLYVVMTIKCSLAYYNSVLF